MIKNFVVDSTFVDMRLDRYLRNKIGNLPQSLIEKRLRNGKIKLNNKKVKINKKENNEQHAKIKNQKSQSKEVRLQEIELLLDDNVSDKKEIENILNQIYKIGFEKFAEQIKISVGSAMRTRSRNILVKGRDLVSGIPKTIDIRTDEIRQALKDPVKRILDVIKDALEATPAELSSDIIDRGIVLAGGGSQLRGLDQVLREKTGVPVNVADEPHHTPLKAHR